jgi:hypothetical protein
LDYFAHGEIAGVCGPMRNEKVIAAVEIAADAMWDKRLDPVNEPRRLCAADQAAIQCAFP